MRDFTKSILSFSWALSLFGVQQAANALSPSKAAGSFDKVTDATKQELCGVTEATFRAGDSLQRGLVDMTFNAFSPQALNPSDWIKVTTDVARQTFGALGQMMPGAQAAQSQSTGWGPVPPVDK